jgi:hypothetical protein
MRIHFQRDCLLLARFSPVYTLMYKKTLKRLLLCSTFVCLIICSVAACDTGSSSSSSPTATVPKTPSLTPPLTPSPTPTSLPTPSPTLSAFKVTSIDMAVSPQSIAGSSCGSSITVAYTATFHIATNGPGGTIKFLYTYNSKSSPSDSVTVNPGQTTATYTFYWSGSLPADHLLPGAGYVMVIEPNEITSPSVKPDGQCT